MMAAVNSAGIQQRLEQRGAIVAALEHHVAHDVVEHVAGVVAAFAALDVLRDVQLHRGHEANGDPWEPPRSHFPLEPRERRVLGALDAYRQHHGVGLVGHHSRSLVHFHERAGHRNASLGKNDDPAILLDVCDQRADRERIGRIDGKGIRERQEEPDDSLLGDVGIDGECQRVRHVGGDQRCIDKRLVVRDDQHAITGLVVILEILNLDAVEGVEKPGHERLHDGAREQLGDVDTDGGVQHRHDEEHLGYGEAGVQHQHRATRGDHHEQRVHDVVAGDISRAVLILAALLHDGVKRNDIDATGDGDQQKRHDDSPAGGGAEKCANSHELAVVA